MKFEYIEVSKEEFLTKIRKGIELDVVFKSEGGSMFGCSYWYGYARLFTVDQTRIVGMSSVDEYSSKKQNRKYNLTVEFNEYIKNKL